MNIVKRVFKYPLPLEVDGPAARWQDRFTMDLPVGLEILSVQAQHNKPVFWALVNPEETMKEKRKFLILNTGGEMPPDVNYHRFYGTVQLNGGGLVFHLFEDMDVPF